MRRALVALLVVAAALVAGASAARAGEVEMMVVPSLDLDRIAQAGGAVGLLVPGSGETVTRAGALSALERGSMRSALVGGVSTGEVLARPAARPGTRVTVYVVLPPAGRSRNRTRYPVAVTGGGYRGLLTSASTRIPGLVSVADVAPTVVALRERRSAPIGWDVRADAAADVRAVDDRLADAARTRDPVTIALVVTALLLAVAGIVLRRATPSLATLAAPLGALAVSLVLSAAGVTSPGAAVALAFGLTVPLALAVAVRRRVAAWLLAAFVAAYLVVLAASPQTAALAAIGPHPEAGGRFFGVTNLVETLLLVASVPVVAAAPAVSGGALALLVLVTVGWSEAGADGGGLLVLGAAYAVVALLRATGRLRPPLVAAAGLAIVAVAVASVLLDRVLGGSSHVTRAVSGGPGEIVADLGHRLETSWHAATHNPHTIAICLVALAALAVIVARAPRTVAGTAILAGLLVSLLVNDSPPDVLVTGALGLAGIAGAARAGEPALVTVPRRLATPADGAPRVAGRGT